MIFSPDFPLSNIDHHQYLFKQFGFIIVQTVYVIYIADTWPHTNNIFNWLEVWNEGLIILMCYIMICYAGIGPVEEILKSNVPIAISIAIASLIMAANLGTMLKMNYTKIKNKLEMMKLKKA